MWGKIISSGKIKFGGSPKQVKTNKPSFNKEAFTALLRTEAHRQLEIKQFDIENELLFQNTRDPKSFKAKLLQLANKHLGGYDAHGFDKILNGQTNFDGSLKRAIITGTPIMNAKILDDERLDILFEHFKIMIQTTRGYMDKQYKHAPKIKCDMRDDRMANSFLNNLTIKEEKTFFSHLLQCRECLDVYITVLYNISVENS